MVKKFLILLVLLCWAGGLWAAESYLVGDIQFEGTKRVKTSDILGELTLRAGQTATADDIDEAIQQIYRMGRFSDISAEILEFGDASVLKFHLTERPLVRNVRFEGTDELSVEKLQAVVTVRVPDIYDPFEVERSIAAIKGEYSKEGYYAVEIKSDVHINPENEALVTFRIKEGSIVRIKDIRFSGNTLFDEGDLEGAMDTQEKWIFSWLTGRGNYDERLLAQDLERIADLYYNQGHVRIKVREPIITLVDNRESMLLLIHIDEGDQYTLGKIDARGDLLKRKGEILNLVDMEPGDVFSREKLRDGVINVTDLYADQGYAYVNVAPLTRVDDKENMVMVMLDIEQGPKVYIERINVTGNTKTRDKVVRREMSFVEGDLYNATALKQSRARINNLGFFEAVDITTSEASDESHINVDVGVTERSTGTFSLGAGYSTSDGVVGQGSITQENFLGRGWKLNLSASIGGESTTYQIGLTDPYFLDTRWTVGMELYRTEREWTDFSRRSSGGAVKVGYPILDYSRLLLVYRYEEKDIYDVDPLASQDIKDEEGTSSIGSLTSIFTRNTTNNRLDPSSGSALEASWEIAGLGGTEKFSKYTFDYRYFWPWRWDTVFMAHGNVGYVQGYGGEDIPLDERFFLGGINTMRGFESREVGPRDPLTGDYTGGDLQAYSNLEFIFPLIKDLKVKGVTFVDVGNAWDNSGDYFSDWRYSAGAGIRWLSPMGPLRLEYGFNLDAEAWEDDSKFDFMVGRFF